MTMVSTGIKMNEEELDWESRKQVQTVISVIVPVFNAERYLAECIESLLAQTLREIEIICVDDMSTDASKSLLLEYQKRDARIRILEHKEKTEGAAQARNMGISAAKGTYLVIVDADDFFEPDMLEKSYEKIESTQADIVMFDAFYYDDLRKRDSKPDFTTHALNGRFLPDAEVFDPKDNCLNMLRMTHGAAWGRLYRRDLIVDNKIQFIDGRYWDDIVFTYTALCSAKKIALLRERLLHYRWNAIGSQTSTKSKYPEVGYKIPYALVYEFKKRGLYETYKIGLVNCAVTRAIYLMNIMDSAESFKVLFFALKNEYLDKLGAYDIEDEAYFDETVLRCRDCIRESDSVAAYLIQKGQFYSQEHLSFEEKLADMTKDKTNIAIYGAGCRGRVVFNEIFSSGLYNIQTWVDRNYGMLGFPVESPEVLKEKEFDYVIVAIEDQKIFDAVKAYLLSIGILEEKILWIF